MKKDRSMEWIIGSFIAFLVAITVTSCRSYKSVSTPTPSPDTIQVPEIVLSTGKVPKFKCVGCTFTSAYEKAFTYLNLANTDQFESFFLARRSKLSHVDGKSPALVIKTFRAQLSLAEEIPVSFYWNPLSKGIGAWDVDIIKQNTKFTFAPKPLAGHLLHEVAHKYGWIHIGNKKYENDSLNSFPYAVGDEFVAFLTEKGL